MKKLLFASCVVFLLVSLHSNTHAQRFKKKSKYSSASLIIGTSTYVGDLDPENSLVAPAIRFTRTHLGGCVTQRMTPRISVRGNLTWSRIKGSDIAVNNQSDPEDYARYVRNLSFRNDIYTLNAEVVIDLFENRRGLERRVHYTPYGFVGVGGFYHNPKAELNGEWVKLQPLGTEGQYLDGVGDSKPYKRVQFEVPFGVGFRYKIGMVWDIAFDMTWHRTFTDYIDDVGGKYVDKANFEQGSNAYLLSDRAAELDIADGNVNGVGKYTSPDGHVYVTGYGDSSGSNRGDIKNRIDWYITPAIHLSYIFHPKVVCPKFRG